MKNNWKATDICIILTACINPSKEVPHLFLKDSEIRREQYIKAAEYYITKTNVKKIVFCDNSEEPVSEYLIGLAQKNNKQFEWISFKGDSKKVVEKGKGYGEGEILKYAIHNSTLINQNDLLIKITGRLIVSNINLLIGLIRKKEIYIYPISSDHGVPFLGTRIFMIPVNLYKRYLEDEYTNVDDNNGYYLEHVYASAVIKYKLKYHILPINPQIQGMSGTSGNIINKIPFPKQVWYTIKMYLFQK